MEAAKFKGTVLVCLWEGVEESGVCVGGGGGNKARMETRLWALYFLNPLVL